MRVTIRPIEHGDRAGWDVLYAGYAAFYRSEQTAEMRDRVWSWLLDPAHPVTAFVAVADDDGALVGLVHFHAFPRPLSASIGTYIDDLFVSRPGRNSRAATLLLKAVKDLSKADGRSILRGITRETNYRARVIYDRVAERTNWVVYDADPEA